MMIVSEAITHAAICAKKAAARSSAKTFPTRTPSGASTTSSSSKDSEGEMHIEKRPIAPMPEELKAVVQEMK